MPPFQVEPDIAFAACFYKCQCGACLLWWLLVFIGSKRPIWSHVHGYVFTRPPYISKSIMFALRRHNLLVFLLVPSSMAIAAANSHAFTARLFAAVCFTAYHLLETSVSKRLLRPMPKRKVLLLYAKGLPELASP